MKEDPYQEFAARYDWMHFSNPAREQFFQSLFAKHSARKVLDCACGTGHDLILFHTLGCEVVGSDLSQAMLNQSRENLEKANLQIPLCQADYCNLQDRFEPEFDAVVCLTNAINEVLEDEQTIQALRSMRSVLRSGGIVVFDQGQTDATMQDPSRFRPVVNTPEMTRMFVVDYGDNIATVNICDFIHTEDLTDFKLSSVQIRIRLLDSWAKVLKEAGFSRVEFFGDWDSSPYDKQTSQRLIAVAQR